MINYNKYVKIIAEQTKYDENYINDCINAYFKTIHYIFSSIPLDIETEEEYNKLCVNVNFGSIGAFKKVPFKVYKRRVLKYLKLLENVKNKNIKKDE